RTVSSSASARSAGRNPSPSPGKTPICRPQPKRRAGSGTGSGMSAMMRPGRDRDEQACWPVNPPAGDAGAPAAAEVFQARCEARAQLWHSADLDFESAVDELQQAAVASGLVGDIGQDAVQQIMAEALSRFRTDEPEITDLSAPTGEETGPEWDD